MSLLLNLGKGYNTFPVDKLSTISPQTHHTVLDHAVRQLWEFYGAYNEIASITQQDWNALQLEKIESIERRLSRAFASGVNLPQLEEQGILFSFPAGESIHYLPTPHALAQWKYQIVHQEYGRAPQVDVLLQEFVRVD